MPVKRRVPKSRRQLDDQILEDLFYGPGTCVFNGEGYLGEHGDGVLGSLCASAFETHTINDAGPGCLCSDTGEENGDQEGIDEREPDYDAEVETWSHWLDHPAELHIGERPGHTDQAPRS